MPDALPNLHRRRLGLALRSLRLSAERPDHEGRRPGLTTTEAAERLGMSGASAISKIELGKQRVPVSQLDGFFNAYEVTSETKKQELRQLASLAASSRRANVLREYTGPVSDPFAEYLHLEDLAIRVETYAPVVAGLLQTEPYAHAIVERSRQWQTRRDIANFVELRLARQHVLTRNPPLQLWCILDEAALRREVGGKAVMKGQLQRLLDLSEDQRNISLQILPFSRGAHAAVDGAFHILYFTAGSPVVVVEPMTTSLYLEDDGDIGRYETGFNYLRTEALDTEASRRLISDTIKDHYT
ncbi:helix-turn-helix transcriptional regulator [Streptomyces sp. NPDC093252]|uniref:helix-turn-helix domain-containing protein n=1 Tax=Streptomyces sp. NPDC093252 TaxID=3154980 RepID=UPI003434FBCF